MQLFKRLMLTSVLFIFLTAVHASAAVVEFTIDDTSFLTEKDGVVTKNVLEAAPFIRDNRTMLPIRAISDAFGAEVSWDAATSGVTVINGDQVIKLTINSPTATIDGEEKTLDAVPVIVNNRTFVPLRFIAEGLHYNVNYVTTTRQIVIDDTPIVLQCGDKTMSFAEYKNLYDFYYYANYNEGVQSGLSAEEYKNHILQGVDETVYSILKTQNTFPHIGISQAGIENVKLGIQEDAQYYQAPTPGQDALMHEKYYLSRGDDVINHIAATENLEDVYQTEYVSAKHILVEDQALADTIYAQVTSGADFDAAIREYNTDPGMEQNPDGYVFTKGEMVAEFEEAAFALAVGEISAPVQTTYGYHIIKREALPAMTEDTKRTIAITIANEQYWASAEPAFLIPQEELYALLG